MTTAPVGQSQPVRLDQMAGNGPGRVPGGDVQRLGPGSAPSKTQKGSAHPTLPSVPASKQKKAPGYSQVAAALDNARKAAKAYDEASTKFEDARRKADSQGHQLSEKELASIQNLKANAEKTLKESAQADIALTAAVSVTIKTSSCTNHNRCNFSSAQKAAAKLDADVRSDGNEKLTKDKDEARARQFALRTQIDSVLSDLAYQSLKQDGDKGLKEVASWVARIDDASPTATSQNGRLKPIIVNLKVGSASDKALIDKLFRACKDQGMEITNSFKAEVGLLPSAP